MEKINSASVIMEFDSPLVSNLANTLKMTDFISPKKKFNFNDPKQIEWYFFIRFFINYDLIN